MLLSSSTKEIRNVVAGEVVGKDVRWARKSGIVQQWMRIADVP